MLKIMPDPLWWRGSKSYEEMQIRMEGRSTRKKKLVKGGKGKEIGQTWENRKGSSRRSISDYNLEIEDETEMEETEGQLSAWLMSRPSFPPLLPGVLLR